MDTTICIKSNLKYQKHKRLCRHAISQLKTILLPWLASPSRPQEMATINTNSGGCIYLVISCWLILLPNDDFGAWNSLQVSSECICNCTPLNKRVMFTYICHRHMRLALKSSYFMSSAGISVQFCKGIYSCIYHTCMLFGAHDKMVWYAHVGNYSKYCSARHLRINRHFNIHFFFFPSSASPLPL